jgi:hypothetical protein
MRSRAAIWFSVFAAAALAFVVARPAWSACAPSAQGIFPASGIVGTSVPATVSGSGLTGATASVFGEPGLSVSVSTATDATVNLQLQIDAAAAPGERIITLTTATGIVAVDFTVNPAGGPIVTGVAPTPTATQGFALDLVVSGQNLALLGASNVTVSGNGVTVSTATPAGDGSSIDIVLGVAADADLGTHALVIASPSGGAMIDLRVMRPAPTISSVTPGAGAVGTSFPITVTGANLMGATMVITSGASGQGGVSITQVATPDDATLTATMTVSGTLAPESEPRLLIVTNESGQSTAEFSVVAAGVPSITGIRPAAGSPTQTVHVTLHGFGLTGAALSTPSAFLTLQNVVVVDDQTITADVVVGAGATVNTNQTITATVGASTANGTFRVIAANAPFIGAIRPPFGNRGATLAVFLDGVNLSTVVSGTGITVSGPKITVSNATAVDALTARAIFVVDPLASIGTRDVSVTTSTGTFTKTSSFRINIPGQVPTISDVSPSIVQPGTTTHITVTGSGLAGAGVTVGGAGATVSNVVVDPLGATITFDLALAAGAAAENRAVIVVTENGTASCGVLSSATLDILAPALVRTGSVVQITSLGYRLFMFEFSINANFDAGLRTYVVTSDSPQLTLSRLQELAIGRAVRDLPFGYVRAQAVTATNLIGTSAVYRFRR